MRGTIAEVLGDTHYLPGAVDAWCDQILDRSLWEKSGYAEKFGHAIPDEIAKTYNLLILFLEY